MNGITQNDVEKLATKIKNKIDNNLIFLKNNYNIAKKEIKYETTNDLD
jgi:hypothetical protein